MLKPFINQIINRQNLTSAEAEEAMDIIMTGQATQAQIGAYLVALRMKGETVDEITGSARAMRAQASPVPYMSTATRCWIRPERAATARTPSISPPRPPLLSPGPGRRWPSTATAPPHPSAAARMCWARWASTSI